MFPLGTPVLPFLSLAGFPAEPSDIQDRGLLPGHDLLTGEPVTVTAKGDPFGIHTIEGKAVPPAVGFPATRTDSFSVIRTAAAVKTTFSDQFQYLFH